MISLSIKIIRSVFDSISVAASFYLLVLSLSPSVSAFQSFVLYPLLLLSVVGLGYFIHSALDKCALKIAGYQIKIIKIQAVSINKQPLAH